MLHVYLHFTVKETENIEGACHLVSQDSNTNANDTKVYICPPTTRRLQDPITLLA